MPLSHHHLLRFLVHVFCCLSLFAGVAHAQTDEALAQLSFSQGLEHYEAERYDRALEFFQRALSLAPSPNSRLLIAHCLHHLGRYGEAMAEYLLTEGEAAARASLDPRYRQTGRTAREAIEMLEGRVGWVTLEIDNPLPGLTLSLSGRDVPVQVLGVPIPVTPGAVAVRARADGYEPVDQELSVAAGQRLVHSLSLNPLPLPPVEGQSIAEPEEPQRSGAFIGSAVAYGLSGAGAVLYGVFGTLALRRYSHLDEICDGRCPVDQGESWSQGRAFYIVANVGFAVAAAALVAGIVMTILHVRGRRQRRAEAQISIDETLRVRF